MKSSGFSVLEYAFGSLGHLQGELEQLGEALKMASYGREGIALVCGEAGIGKTTLVKSLKYPLTRIDFLFADGKFDQYRHDTPYSGLVQAFAGLAGRLPENFIDGPAQWAQSFREAFGKNGRLITDLIPSIARIAGEQPPVDPLPPAQGLSRFHQVFRDFVRVFAHERHPLVLFLDDLHWADPATLALLEYLLIKGDLPYFFCIGAYRDNEIGPSHPLQLFLQALETSGIFVRTIRLRPLSSSGVQALIKDTFGMDLPQSPVVARLIMERTHGNPFYAIQFLKALYQDGLILFDEETKEWNWNLEAVLTRPAPGDVVKFMRGRVSRLSPVSLEALCLSACVGTTFSLRLLASVWGKTEAETREALAEVLEEGLLIPLDDSTHDAVPTTVDRFRRSRVSSANRFAFLHDRVREAAYSLIPGPESDRLHYRIGTLVLRETAPEDLPDRLFFIVNHLNMVSAPLATPQELLELARLNLEAGRKAKAAAAYAAASDYLARAGRALPANCWSEQYDLTLDIFLERSEIEYLSGSYQQAWELFQTVLREGRGPLPKARVFRFKAALRQNQGDHRRALEAGRQGLELLGYHLPDTVGRGRLMLQILEVKALMGGKKPADLLSLPRMQDPEKREIMALLVEMVSPAYFSGINLYTLVALEMVKMSIMYGNTSGSATGYAAYAMVLSGQFGQYAAGHDLCSMAIELAVNLGDMQGECIANFGMGGMMGHWREPLEMQLENLTAGYRAGLAAGELVHAGYNITVHATTFLFLGRSLSQVDKECEKALNLLEKIRHEDMILATTLARQVSRALQGRTVTPLSLGDNEVDEEQMVESIRNERSRMLLAIYYLYKLMLAYLAGEYEDAARFAAELDGLADALFAMHYEVWRTVFTSLSLAALFPAAGTASRWRFSRRIAKNKQLLKKWSENCPENFLHLFLLVAAEQAGIEGRSRDAVSLHDQAAAAARQRGCLLFEAIANSCASRFFWAMGQEQDAILRQRQGEECFRFLGAPARRILQ